jgi:hypothetical protein
MTASPQLLILEALLGLFEERLDTGAATPRADLVLLGHQLHHLNGLYIRLVETTIETDSNCTESSQFPPGM